MSSRRSPARPSASVSPSWPSPIRSSTPSPARSTTRWSCPPGNTSRTSFPPSCRRRNQPHCAASATAVSDHFANNLSENSRLPRPPPGRPAPGHRRRVPSLEGRDHRGPARDRRLRPLARIAPSRRQRQHGSVPARCDPAPCPSHRRCCAGPVLRLRVPFRGVGVGVAMERLRRWPRWPNETVGLPVAILVCGAALIPLVPALPYPEIAVDTPSLYDGCR